ncbi:MAG: hypothetical protein KKC23_04300, partial [Proteobacteria bacterium]|nr:hypothetical protein [Pseudomonadota bacterium]
TESVHHDFPVYLPALQLFVIIQYVFPPFTEHGAIMEASVINSPLAIASSIFVVRAFVRLRKMVETHTELLQKVGELEDRLESHDEQIQSIFEAIRQLMMPPAKPRKKIGFGVKEKKAAYGRRGVKRKKAKRA